MLRSSSCIVWGLVNGASKIIPVDDLGSAVSIASRMGDCVLAGERGAVLIPGFDIGNSPAEYTEARVGGKAVVISTTNGTGAICKSESASNVLIGSMLNCTAVAKRAVELGNDVILMCAGTGGEFSADDIYAAGAIASAIQTLTDAELCDLTRVSCLVYDRWKEDRTELSKTKHYKRLVSLGLESDINFCLTRDLTDIVPSTKRRDRALKSHAAIGGFLFRMQKGRSQGRPFIFTPRPGSQNTSKTAPSARTTLPSPLDPSPAPLPRPYPGRFSSRVRSLCQI